MNEDNKDLMKWLSKLEDKFVNLRVEMDSNKLILKAISHDMKEIMNALNYVFERIEVEEEYILPDENLPNSLDETVLENNYKQAFNYLITKKLKDLNLLEKLSKEEIENFKKLEEELKEVKHMLTPGIFGKA